MNPYRIIDSVMGDLVKVRILRHLIAGHGAQTGRALARIALVSPPSVLKPLRELVNEGILTRKVIGNGYAFDLNRNNILVKEGLLPLFQLENQILCKLGEHFSKFLRDKLDSLIIYGSVARGTSTSMSDWDLLVLCHPKDVEKTKAVLEKCLSVARSIFSSTIDVKIMSTSTFCQKFFAKDRLINEVYKDYINSRVINPLAGRSLLEIIGEYGQRHKNKSRK